MTKDRGQFGIPELSELYIHGMKVSDLARDSETTFVSQTVDHNERFWSTQPRLPRDNYREILIIRFNSPKLINYINFEHVAFPHNYRVYKLNLTEEWRVTTQREDHFYSPLQDYRGRNISKTHRGATPYVVNTALTRSAGVHPQHFGQGHWIFEEYELKPTETEAIAIAMTRDSGTNIHAPVDENDDPVPYSLGIRNLDVGYRVRNKDDIPYTNRDPQITTEYETFTQVTDIAGSMVELKLRENKAEDLLQQRAWKSEPQPVSYSVVNLFVDARDEEGNAQVVDRFFIDPITSGPNLNLYYSTEVPPQQGFGASDSPLTFPLASAAGPGLVSADQDGILFPNDVGFLDISNKRIQWNPADPFWVGMTIQPFWEPGTEDRHVILDMESFRLEYYMGRFQLVSPQGILSLEYNSYEDGENEPPEEDDEDLGLTDPEELDHVEDSEYFRPYETLSLVFGFDGNQAFLYSRDAGLIMADATAPGQTNPTIMRFGSTIGQVPDEYIPVGNFRLRSFVLKSEALDWSGEERPNRGVPWDASGIIDEDPGEEPIPELEDDPDSSEDPGEGDNGEPEDPEPLPDPEPGVPIADPTDPGVDPEEWENTEPEHAGGPEENIIFVPLTVTRFIEDPYSYNRKTPFITEANDQTRNALLRMIPEFITHGGEDTLNPFGFQGGPPNLYDKIKWTPIARDYKLRRGELQFYPTKAKFFKFEFTDLSPQPYDVHTPVRRETKVYASEVKKADRVLRTPAGSTTFDLGLASQAHLNDYFMYADAVRFAVRNVTGQDVSPTEALYAQGLSEKERLDQFGSMYQFHPWHPNATAPKNQEYREHYYETISVEMKQRIAYFVGLSQLLMYRQDYHVDDDTPEYIETFQDLSFIDDNTLEERLVAGYVNGISNPGFESSDILKSWTVVTEGNADNATLDRLDSVSGLGSSAFGDHFAHLHSTETSDDESLVGITQSVSKDVVPDLFPVGGDGEVSLSFYGRTPGLDGRVEVRITGLDGDDNVVSSHSQPFEFSGQDNVWQRYKVIAEISEDAETLEISVLTMSEPENGVFNADFHLDAFLLEEGSVISDYVDGSFENAIWIGGEYVPSGDDEGEEVYVSGPDAPSRMLDKIVQPWEWNEEYIKSPAALVNPVTIESDVFMSRRNVRGVQFATTQSAAKQLLNDSYLKDENMTFWEAVGDSTELERKILDGNSLDEVVAVKRFPGANVYGDMELQFPEWGEIEGHGWSDLEGSEDTQSTGGIRYSRYVFTSQKGRVYAAARVYTDKPLSSPLSLQVVDNNNSVLAERTVVPRARGVTEWWVPFNIGDTGELTDQTWGDIELRDPDPLLPIYGDLEAGQWRDITSVKFQEARELSVQIIQQGSSKDTFYVDNISLFEDAIRWQFSNDGGTTWHDAYGIKNNPSGVLIFPPVANPQETRQNRLKWRATGYRPNLYVGNLTIRPWYGGLTYGVQHRDYSVSFGPNVSPADQFDIISEDPFFTNYLGPLPQDWYFSFRQLLMYEREYVPVERQYRPKAFGNQYSGHLDPNMPPPSDGMADLYPGTYSFIYGVPESDNSYVTYYDPENTY